MALKQLKPRIKRTLNTTTAVKKSTGTPRLRGAKWEKLRNIVLSNEPLCRLCAAKNLSIKAVEVDHIIPLHKNGTNEINNLQPLCWQCHYDKSQSERKKFYKF
jgi:5-methylcytosine-specific restriction protein A